MTSAAPLFDDISRRLVAAGYDPVKAGEAINWLIKACHPAWTGTCGPVPDHAFSASVCPDYTVQVTVEAPNVGGNWDFIVWQPPGDCTAAVIGTGAAGIDFSTNVASTNNGADGHVVRQYLYFQALGGLNGTPLTQIPGTTTNNAVSTYPTQVTVPVSNVRSLRVRYGGLTVYPVASSLYDQGTIFAGQFARAPALGPAMGVFGNTGAFVPNGTTVMCFQTNYVDLPFNEGPMALLDPASKAWPFRNGAYLPKRFVDPSIEFVSMPAFRDSLKVAGNTVVARDVSLFMPPGVGVSQQTYLSSMTIPTAAISGASYYPVPWLDPWSTAISGFTMAMPETYDTTVTAMSHPVVIGRGLAPQASITIRAYVGLEYIPSWDSPILQFSRAGVAPAPQVMDLYHAIVHDLGATVYPSSFNSLGTILGSIARVVKGAFPVVMRAALPVLSSMFASGGGPAASSAAAPTPPRRAARPPARSEVTTQLVPRRAKQKVGKRRKGK